MMTVTALVLEYFKGMKPTGLDLSFPICYLAVTSTVTPWGRWED